MRALIPPSVHPAPIQLLVISPAPVTTSPHLPLRPSRRPLCAPLCRRGYRDVMHRAALNEAAAAGVLLMSGWRQALEEAGDGEGKGEATCFQHWRWVGAHAISYTGSGCRAVGTSAQTQAPQPTTSLLPYDP